MLFIKKNNDLTEISETTYTKEDQMQQYIYENPQILPVEELTRNKKLIVLIRELNTHYGRLDGLGIDEAGNVYIIETKLLRNPDRRNIIAQLFDYGVALWTEYKDPQDLIDLLHNKWINIKALVTEHFEMSDDFADVIINNFKQNLKQWVYQFVAVTDAISTRILEQIHFINQNSRFSFFLVDLRYYCHENAEFIIPKWYGGEIIKQTSTWSSTSVKQSDIAEFLDVVESNLGVHVVDFYRQFSELLQSKGYNVEIRVWKKTAMVVYQDKTDKFLFSIDADTWALWISKKTKKTSFDRAKFFTTVFGDSVDINTPKNEFQVKYAIYQDNLEEILENISQLSYNNVM